MSKRRAPISEKTRQEDERLRNEEILRFIKLNDDLAALHVREFELHVEYIRERNKLLEAKLSELGIERQKTPS